MKNQELPITNEAGYYEIRLESVGGMGANLCGKLLGELGAMYLGINAASFASYGSEKRGSPVKAYIRWCKADQELRINSPVETPQLLGLFHEAMLEKSSALSGITEETHIVLNTPKSPQEAQEKLRISQGLLYCIDAQKAALDHKSRLNMVMLGALVKASGFIPLEPVLQLIQETMGKKYPHLLENNLAGVRAGYEQMSEPIKLNVPPQAEEEEKRLSWGYRTAPIGGVNPRIGSTVSNDVSASREGYIPLFHPERCIHCALCDSTCPDMVFQFHEGEYKGKQRMINGGLDYHHCKGCLRCVAVCPTEALTAEEERNYPQLPHFVRNQDLIAEHIDFNCVGANSWITSEAYLKEKPVDAEGGIE